MLSRTADSLYWLARYIERAETAARFVDTARRMSAIPQTDRADAANGYRSEWPSVLAASGCAAAFFERGEPATPANVMRFMVTDRDNPSSIASCFDSARQNARGARGALTVEMWEAVNDAWIEICAGRGFAVDNGSLSVTVDWVKARAAAFRGAADGTALRNDGFEFLRLGSYIERTDSTARLLDMRYFGEGGASTDDPYDWISLLNAAGVLRAYHAAYCADYDAQRIAEFLIWDPQCPRSLAHCAERTSDHLNRLSKFYGRRWPCHSLAEAALQRFHGTHDRSLSGEALHAFLSDAIIRNNELSLEIARAYHFAPKAAPEEALGAAAGASAIVETATNGGARDRTNGAQRPALDQRQTATGLRGEAVQRQTTNAAAAT